MSFELGDKHWHISIGGDRRSVRHCIAKAAARLHTTGKARVHSCYGAGRDG